MCSQDPVTTLDHRRADLSFQVISQRYGRGSIILPINQPFWDCSSIFNNNSTIASTLLDQLL
jgi:DNA replication protein DnaC